MSTQSNRPSSPSMPLAEIVYRAHGSQHGGEEVVADARTPVAELWQMGDGRFTEMSLGRDEGAPVNSRRGEKKFAISGRMPKDGDLFGWWIKDGDLQLWRAPGYANVLDIYGLVTLDRPIIRKASREPEKT